MLPLRLLLPRCQAQFTETILKRRRSAKSPKIFLCSMADLPCSRKAGTSSWNCRAPRLILSDFFLGRPKPTTSAPRHGFLEPAKAAAFPHSHSGSMVWVGSGSRSRPPRNWSNFTEAKKWSRPLPTPGSRAPGRCSASIYAKSKRACSRSRVKSGSRTSKSRRGGPSITP